MEIDAGGWSGEGDFTRRVIDRLRIEPRVAHLRIEDASGSRSEAQFNFISNELYVRFAMERRASRGRVLGILPLTRAVATPALSLRDLESFLRAEQTIGAADYADDGMLQYLRTQRIVPPYQTRGYKLVELVRIYAVGAAPAP